MAAAAALGAAGGVVQAVGAIREGNAANAAAQYNANVAQQNAQQVRAQAEEEARRNKAIAKKQIGSMRAGYAASGVTLEGSPLDVLAESASNAELDSLTTRHSGEIRAQSFDSEARLERFRGTNALTSSRISAAGALLGAGARGASG
jgi:hypothetical protein